MDLLSPRHPSKAEIGFRKLLIKQSVGAIAAQHFIMLRSINSKHAGINSKVAVWSFAEGQSSASSSKITEALGNIMLSEVYQAPGLGV